MYYRVYIIYIYICRRCRFRIATPIYNNNRARLADRVFLCRSALVCRYVQQYNAARKRVGNLTKLMYRVHCRA